MRDLVQNGEEEGGVKWSERGRKVRCAMVCNFYVMVVKTHLVPYNIHSHEIYRS